MPETSICCHYFVTDISNYFFLRAISSVDPPDPIPNSEVKHTSADDTWGAAPWESRTARGFIL